MKNRLSYLRNINYCFNGLTFITSDLLNKNQKKINIIKLYKYINNENNIFNIVISLILKYFTKCNNSIFGNYDNYIFNNYEDFLFNNSQSKVYYID